MSKQIKEKSTPTKEAEENLSKVASNLPLSKEVKQ